MTGGSAPPSNLAGFWMKPIDSRSFGREEARFPVKLRLDPYGGREIRGESRNFGLGGIYLVSPEVEAPLILGGWVLIEVSLSAAEPVVLRTQGRIIRVEALEEETPLVGIAVRFDEALEYHFSPRR